jgi:hypothetical protein
MSTARYYGTTTLLPNGKVLVAGGYGASGYLASAEMYDPATGAWTATGSMTTARYGHTATLLPSGQVLAAGGIGISDLASAELYIAAAGAWTPTGSMTAARDFHTATLLPSGQVLAAGGVASGSAYLASAELYGNPGDTSAPTASPTQSPAANAAGWNNTDVSVTWNWTDNAGGVGIDPANCTTTSSTVSLGDGSHTLNATCKDLAGNTGTASYTVKIDKTPPTITATAVRADSTAYIAGTWTNQTVTVSFACGDALSGVPLCPANQVFSAEGVFTAIANATDAAGNLAVATFGPIQIDKTSPFIVPSATKADSTPYTAGTWTNQSVTIHFTCSDAASGLAICPADQVLSADGVTALVNGVSADYAGNIASSGFGPVWIDKTPPTLSPVVSPNPVALNGTATATAGAADALSGVASQSCGAVLTGSPGTASVTCTATDNAGNTSSTSASYVVTSSAIYSPGVQTTDFGSVNICPGGQTIPAPCSNSLVLKYGIDGSVTFGSTETVLTEGSPKSGFHPGQHHLHGQPDCW